MVLTGKRVDTWFWSIDPKSGFQMVCFKKGVMLGVKGGRGGHQGVQRGNMYAQCALHILFKFLLEGVDFHCKFIHWNASDDKLLKLAQHPHTHIWYWISFLDFRKTLSISITHITINELFTRNIYFHSSRFLLSGFFFSSQYHFGSINVLATFAKKPT